MVVETNQNQDSKRESYLKRYVRQQIMPYRFINFGRNTKLSKCIGLIGPRGSCKSLAASAMGIIDYLIPGYKLISNMDISWGLQLGNDVVHYHSDKLDKMEFLKFNIQDKVAVLVDEVNIEFSEARRSMTNRNLIFNKILQQLRKRQLNVIYTVQHEMWIDNRLRWQTDIFIKTMDVCLKPGGIYLPYDFGEFASWKVYDMAGIFGHGSYADTMKPVIEDWRFNGKRWWNTFNTNEIQGLEDQVYGAKLTSETPSYIEQYNQKWGWLADKAKQLYENGLDEITSGELTRYVGEPLTPQLRQILKTYGITWNVYKQKYDIESYKIGDNKPEREKEKELIKV